MGATDRQLLVDDEKGNAGNPLLSGSFGRPGDVVQKCLIVELTGVESERCADLDQSGVIANVDTLLKIGGVNGVQRLQLFAGGCREDQRMREQGIRCALDLVPVEIDSRSQTGVADAQKHWFQIGVALDRLHVIAEVPARAGHTGLQEKRMQRDFGRVPFPFGESSLEILHPNSAPGANGVVDKINGQ